MSWQKPWEVQQGEVWSPAPDEEQSRTPVHAGGHLGGQHLGVLSWREPVIHTCGKGYQDLGFQYAKFGQQAEGGATSIQHCWRHPWSTVLVLDSSLRESYGYRGVNSVKDCEDD